MIPYRGLKLCAVVMAAAFSTSNVIAVPVTIFKDDFQTDTAGTGNVGQDLDPLIDTDAGDIGSWTIREGSTGTNFPSGLQRIQ